MKRKAEVYTILRGQPIVAKMEYDITGPGQVKLHILLVDENKNTLEWELTREELAFLCRKAAKYNRNS